MGNSDYAHNSSCIYMSHLSHAEFYSSFQHGKGVTALEETGRVLDACQETSGPWKLGRYHKYLGWCNRHVNCIALQKWSVQKIESFSQFGPTSSGRVFWPLK